MKIKSIIKGRDLVSFFVEEHRWHAARLSPEHLTDNGYPEYRELYTVEWMIDSAEMTFGIHVPVEFLTQAKRGDDHEGD